jgi:hypothetical protein
MKTIRNFTFIGLLLLCGSFAQAQHSHFVSGAEAPVPGAKLIAVNSNDFLHVSDYVRTLPLSTSGTYAGFYNASCPFIVAAATPAFGGPEAGAPALGSFIEMQFISLTGPSGGVLGYWEALRTGSANFTIASGTTNGTNRIALSDASLGAGQPGADPFGHIHGRRLTANVPGFYMLGYRFLDTSTNGLNRGPIHTPSEIYYLYLQAGFTVPFINSTTNGVAVTYGTALGMNFFLEFRETLDASTQWTTIQGPIAGDDLLHTFVHKPSSTAGFYQTRAVAP